MSSLVISGDTSGAVTLAAPAVAGTTTLTLPATTGSVIGSNSSGDIQFNSGFGSEATAYGCRAWVNFNGTGTVAIRASGNVTSITDNGVGDYTVNFTTTMSDANYCFSGSARSPNTTNRFMVGQVNAATQLTTALPFTVVDASTGTNTDCSTVNILVIR